jgi:MscS family membrane protein
MARTQHEHRAATSKPPRRGWIRAPWLIPLGVLLLLAASTGSRAAIESQEVEVGEPDTPRRALARFLAAVHAGRYAEAAFDLELASGQSGEGARLAQRLGAVIDRRLTADPEWLGKISDAPSGDVKDGLPFDAEEIGRVPGPPGVMLGEPVRLRRITDRQKGTFAEPRWVFSHKTVTRTEGWYQRLDDLWLREHLPTRLLRTGPRGFVLWEWLALPVLFVGSLTLAFLLVSLSRVALRPLLRRAKARWDGLLLRGLRRPALLLATCALWGWSTPYLLITAQAERTAQTLARAGLLLGVFWGLWRCVDVAVQLVRESAWLRTHPAASGILPLGYRIAEVTVLSLAVVTALQELGYPVTSLVAGLGIGGLAVALAAQKTVEHVFGGVMLAVDQPMRVGDYVRVDDTAGWVEHIGLRSTRIRTLDRTLVTIPNGKLADMKIECIQARDRARLHFTLGVTYDLSAERLDQLRRAVLDYITAHPKLWKDQLHRVHFTGFGESALNIEVMAWFLEGDWDRFLEIRHNILLDVMRIVEAQGAKVAFPTRTLHMVPPPGPPPRE